MELPAAVPARAQEMIQGDRFARMVHLGLTLAAEPDPDAQLRHLYDEARAILQADHVEMLLPNPAGQLPQAGPLLRERAALPLRVAAPTAALDPASLPRGLPPLGSLLAMPVRNEGGRPGWLVLGRAPGKAAFSATDEQIAAMLASGLAIFRENMRLYRQAQRHARELRREIAQRERSESALRRLTRIHGMRSRIAAEIVRTRNQAQLFKEVCRTAVDQGGFRMAWIGVLQGEIVEPVACHGHDHGYMQLLREVQRGGHRGGPALKALQERREIVCNDIAREPMMEPWRDAALQRGYRSLAILPIFARSRLAGCLALYAGEVNFFSEEEQRLLVDLAGDISHALEFIAAEEQLDFLSYYDPLTGLANRRLFHERLNQHLLAARQAGGRLAVIVVDLVQFKAVNDALGMAAGDEVLKSVAERLTRLAGNPAYLARTGGDRFAALIPDLKDASSLSIMLRDRSWTHLSHPIEVAGRSLSLSGKVGLSLFPEDGEDAESLFRNAEAALKKAKQTGERYLFYTAQMGSAMKHRLELEAQLRHALQAEQFVLYYQPKVDLRSGTICGAEALIRWASPELGLVPPAQFIPLLEETGLIVDVGRWALDQALADRARWLREGVLVPRIAVNVSAVQLRDADFLDHVCAALQGHPENAGGLELELTESTMLADPEATLPLLQQLRDMGVGLAVDDFGTGYSSLSYLSKLPLSTVKIDRSFVLRMGDSANTISIVSSVISLAHSMGLRVVAEGVDSREQVKFLRLLHCDEMQGFLFSTALPPEEFLALLRKGRTLPAE
ncbi:putative bifunctional diguanylate cyclase/phosphodiesterase [Solimonas sp. K1W22B-7]|uniref:putative bifunctional diguanylate cyclase/phosphodiesterase n=1 Tax=Solimonas sp. K1W22B-7 TaxID=2303331 RepID=UPI0013C484FA|nr:GGDEF domain-containing protein [Solimonas sp. K1W22B-7]